MSRRLFKETSVVCLACFLSLFAASRSHADIIMQTDENGTPFFSDHGPSFFGSDPQPSHISRHTNADAPKGNFSEVIHYAGRTHGVDPKLIRSVISAESDFNKYAVSNKGAHGLMQLTLPTAALYNVKNVFDPYENINGGARHLKYLIDKFNGDLRLAVAAYNAGETAVIKYSGVPPYPETMHYVDKVMDTYSGRGNYQGRNQNRPGYYIYYGGKQGSMMITDTPRNIGDKTKNWKQVSP